jgi:hypothetical protein
MNKSLIIITFCGILLLFNSIDYPGEAYCVFDSIEYPKIILIPKKFNNEMKVSYFIKYKYFGESLVSNDNRPGGHSYYLGYFPKGIIHYFTREKKILPGAMKFFKECGLSACIMLGKMGGGNTVEPLLINKGIEQIEIDIFSPSIFEDTDIDEAIKAKELSKIVIAINEIKIKWRLTDQEYKEQPRVRKGEYMMKVNKTIKIKVKYEDEINKAK